VTKTFLVDLDRCIGCLACEIACKDENDLAPGIRRIKINAVDVAKFDKFYVPVFELEKRGVVGCTLCPQLQAEGRVPACSLNCLTNAIYFGESGEIETRAKGMKGEKLILQHMRANVVYVSRKPIGEDVKVIIEGR
jgi:Fe-S-cluster-containing dehydrogenase component